MNQPAKKQQAKPKEAKPKEAAQKTKPKQPSQPVAPQPYPPPLFSRPKQSNRPQPLLRMQTGMDGMNFEEYYALNQNFEEIKKELAQIVQQ